MSVRGVEMSEQTKRSLAPAPWVSTRFGGLYHIARDAKTTLCGRIAFDFADAPFCSWTGRACEVCLRRYVP